MKVITRVEAIEAGTLRFYTGKKCRHGHDSERFTSNGVCVECSAKHSSDYQTKLRKLIHSKRAEINAQGNVQEVY